MIVPENVKAYVREVFKNCNQRVSGKLSKCPATCETSLNLTLIEHLSNYKAPIKLKGNWIIQFDTHFLGEMTHQQDWGMIDIGILIIFKKNGRAVKSKIALLQSKKLCANELLATENNKETTIQTIGGLFESDSLYAGIIGSGVLHFDESSKYPAIKSNSEQWEAIKEYQMETNIPTHYLLYNPCQIPYALEIPLTSEPDYSSCCAGARVIPATAIMDKFSSEPDNFSPAFGDLKFLLNAPFNEIGNEGGWRLEDFITDELMTDGEGYNVRGENNENLFNVFNKKSGPLISAFSITFDIGKA